jgi:hypothetical protein
MTEKWSSSAGPIQTKRVLNALRKLHDRAFTTIEKCGVIGVNEYAIERRVFRYGTGDERTAGTDAILAIYERVGEHFDWSITRDTVKAIESAVAAALVEAKLHVAIEDGRTTPAQAAEASRQRAADTEAKARAAAIDQAKRDAAWAPILATAGRADALVVAELMRDTSDPMSDYCGNTTVRRVAIGVRYGRREDFRQIRTAADRFLRAIGESATIAKLTEHRDNHSMGRGNYVSDHGWDGAGSGWTFKTWSLPLSSYSTRQLLEDMMPPTDAHVSGRGRDANTAGVQIAPSSMRDGYVEIRFSEKPDATVLAALKGSGFRWALRSRCWYGPEPRVPASLALHADSTIVVDDRGDTAVPTEVA